MAVPKKRTGHSAQGKRRSNWKATKPETTVCSNCGQPVLTHTVCTACGCYKGKPVSLKDRTEEEVKSAKVEATVEEKPKKTRNSTKAKKSEETAEVKEETKAEAEVTEEAPAEEKESTEE